MQCMTPQAAGPLDLFRIIGSTGGEPTVLLLPSDQGNDPPGCRLRHTGDGSDVTVPPRTVSVCA
jgi:hypothetical protein